jgi:hypothetical protein
MNSLEAICAILILHELCNCHYCGVVKLQNSCRVVLNGCVFVVEYYSHMYQMKSSIGWMDEERV